jgi:tyrosinase
MPNMRKDAWKLGTGWNDTLLWYARGVKVLQSRAIDDPTSWTFLAAMHGFDPSLWSAFGYLPAPATLPSPAVQAQLWKQCQHQSWYFLPWHRGYLGAFETIVRSAIVGLNGPADWALPYWNYNDPTNPNAGKPPPAFQLPTLPDGSPNPLHVTRRYGDGSGNINLDPRQIQLKALRDSHFAGSTGGGASGFGGVVTTFSHSGRVNGELESQPHNAVHGLVGGAIRGTDPNNPVDLGLMSMPDTAALDPIFWVHHSNIDRLWEVWRNRDPRDLNPTVAAWLTGPANRTFAMPGPDGKPYTYTAKDMVDTKAPNLNYIYEDISDPLGGANRLTQRLTRLAMASRVAGGTTTGRGRRQMPRAQAAELIGASDAAVNLTGGPVDTDVRMDRAGIGKVARSFASPTARAAATEPDRVFLNLENIRGVNDAAVFSVYVNLPPGADPNAHPDHLAGVVSLFGVAKATRADGAHGGNGITEVLEITDLVDALHLNNALDLEHLSVRFVPHTDIRPDDKISVERISVYRQAS